MEDNAKAVCTIKLLADAPEYTATVAAACLHEWPKESQAMGLGTQEAYERDLLTEHQSRTSWPATLVAVAPNGQLLGTIALLRDDMPDRPDLAPWIASLIVTEAARGKGVATMLINAILKLARGMGITKVYLWAKHCHRGMYARRGFVDVEQRTYLGNDVVIMVHELDPAGRPVAQSS